MTSGASGERDLIEALVRVAGREAVRTDEATLNLMASDLHVTGCRPLAVIRPADAASVARVVAEAVARNYAILPRGGGLSYTGGYAPPTPRAVTLDMGGLDRIIEISEQNMFITVEAGVTWKQIDAALKPRGLRLPYFGTFSGAGATVGGGLSHGALFFGSARYGAAADITLGLEVALADGTLLRTGQGALAAPSKPFLRSFGPDLTGLFTHDGGAFGVKTSATFRLIRRPAREGFVSFAFANLESAADALSDIARADVAEEVYILDPAVTGDVAVTPALMAKTALSVARAAGGTGRAIGALLTLVRGGRRVVPKGHYSLHLVAAGRTAGAARGDLALARQLARRHGGRAIAATIPHVARAELFRNLNAVLDPDGGRWAALNAKVAHSDARTLIAAFDAMIAPHQPAMAACGVTVTRLASALANHGFSFEPVFHWRDSWLPVHRQAAEPAHLATLAEPADNPEARALVDHLRRETVELFREQGAASNQIGRTYPYLEALSPPPAALLRRIKDALDPQNLINPGVLGLGELPTEGAPRE